MTNDAFKSITILIVPTNGKQNIKSCQILAQELQARGHRIVFSVDSTAKGLISVNGIEEEVQDSVISSFNSNKSLSNKDLILLNSTPIENIKNFCLPDLVNKFQYIKDREYYYEKLIQRVKPDIIIVESVICSPALTNSGIPWVWLNFGAPNFYLNDDRAPPAWSGLPKNGKRSDWDKFNDQVNDVLKGLKSELNEWIVSRGAPNLSERALHPHSPYLNIYFYPTELDYTKLLESWDLKNWVQFDCLMDKPKGTFDIPEKLIAKKGKLIYLSMGECAELELMKKLTTYLSKSQNKFVVSKGPFHDQYELPDNMWGAEDLPQELVIPQVDLVITCGDNKTINESFFNSKQLIVLPLFGAQLDNGQRVRENGFGLTLDPYVVHRETLLCLIESMLDDNLLIRRLSNISYRMQTSEARKQAAARIENLIKV